MATEKQLALVNYLLNRLGFENQYGQEFIKYLASSAKDFRTVRAKTNAAGDVVYPSEYSYIDYLVDEYRIKSKREFVKMDNRSTFISGSDLANFTYCPVSFAISKSFKTIKTKSAEIGTSAHERYKLVNRIKASEGWIDAPTLPDNKWMNEYITDQNKDFFLDVKHAQCSYVGHSVNNEEKNYFKNEELNYIGQPDYVFRKQDGSSFIVEEKFKHRKFKNFDAFYQNNKVQLASYICYLKEFKAEYGYLVYWIYDYVPEDDWIYSRRYLKVQRCHVWKIYKNQAQGYLNEVFHKLKEFIREKTIKIEKEKISANRCANCVNSMYCGHKTKRYQEVSLPYDLKYHKLFPEPYPEILKKDSMN